MLRNAVRRYSTLSPTVVLSSLKERGLVNNSTNISLNTSHKNGSPSVYVGFDPTADSLHTGNLVTIVALIHFQRAGYQPLAVVGGATGVIGDPSGRTKERSVLSETQLANNISGISATLSRISRNVEEVIPNDRYGNNVPRLPIRILNNADWYQGMSVIDFMSDIGRHFRLSYMLNKESVHQRLNSPEGISFTEFSYQVFQAYDFLRLSKDHQCWLQIGGGDQWGNISAGCEFVHKYSSDHVHGLTVPLITNSQGKKLGKSAGNAIWLSPEKTSPFHFYQYFFNTTDHDVERYLNYFTFTPMEDILELIEQHKVNPQQRIGQKHLAECVTKLVHGEEGLTRSQNATAALFGDSTSLSQLPAEDIENLFNNAPSCTMSKSILASDPSVVDVVVHSGAVKSRNQARRLISAGGLYINNVRVQSSDDCLSHDGHVIDHRITIVRTGKKNHFLIRWTNS